jgi:hypothetical protein
MTDQANDTVAGKTSGAAAGLGIGAVLGLAAIPFVKSEAPVEGVVMLVGALIGIAADRRLSKRERLMGGVAAILVCCGATIVVLSH